MELEHFSHPHALILKEDQECSRSEEVICSRCKESIPAGPRYTCCISCDFSLHQKCAELPQEIKSNLHTEHPLFLLAKPPPDYWGTCVCDLCNKECSSFVYHCSVCQFDLDIKCALPPCIYEIESEEHRFRRLLKSTPLNFTSFTCNFCGSESDESPFLCTLCQLMLHEGCITLPRTFNIRQHPHLLTHTYFPQEDESGKPCCGVCQIQFKSGHGGYQCKD